MQVKEVHRNTGDDRILGNALVYSYFQMLGKSRHLLFSSSILMDRRDFPLLISSQDWLLVK